MTFRLDRALPGRGWRAAIAGFLVGLCASAGPAYAQMMQQPKVSPRHLLMLRPGIDAVWGSYVFAVENPSESRLPLMREIMLPEETVDFQPQEGLKPKDLQLTDDGIRVSTEIDPGNHLISIGFKVDGRLGEAQLTLNPPYEVGSLTVLVPKRHELSVEAEELSPSSESRDPRYRSYQASGPLAAGKAVEIRVSGLPEGRGRLWILGSVFGGLLLLSVLWLAFRTRPKITGSAEETVLIG